MIRLPGTDHEPSTLDDDFLADHPFVDQPPVEGPATDHASGEGGPEGAAAPAPGPDDRVAPDTAGAATPGGPVPAGGGGVVDPERADPERADPGPPVTGPAAGPGTSRSHPAAVVGAGSVDAAVTGGGTAGAEPEVAADAEAEAGGESSTAAAGTSAGPVGADPSPLPGVHPRLWQRRVSVLREQGRRRLRWVVAAVVVLIVAGVAMVALHTPLVAVRSVTMTGAPLSQQDAVLGAAGLLGNPPLIDVDPRTAALHIEALPWVAHAVVQRAWPDAVAITVRARTPLAAVPRHGGGVAVIDATGHVIAWQSSASPGLFVSGPVPPGPPGSVLSPADRAAVETAAALPPAVAPRVLQISVNRRGVVAMNLGGGLSAVVGSVTDLHQKMAALVTVLDEARPPAPAVIDLTVPDEPAVGPPPWTP